ncbi:MAG: hypothetical protein JNJ88_18270 [Planctomycetes bacterium]|nr:hypothetical protein [Planctomycetota bacterium]
MCLAIYVGCEAPLPESAWDKNAPGFFLEQVPTKEAVRGQFRSAHVYYAGSHEGCGCGFAKDGKDGDELEQCQQNYRALAAILSPAVSGGAQVQIFTCWEGEQTKEARTAEAVTVTQLVVPGFEFQQRTLLTVREGK